MQTVMLIGPGCGLILFSFFLKLNEDPWCKYKLCLFFLKILDLFLF